jgi:hypothetical protein
MHRREDHKQKPRRAATWDRHDACKVSRDTFRGSLVDAIESIRRTAKVVC